MSSTDGRAFYKVRKVRAS